MSTNGKSPEPEHFDVLIVGAGLSGIGAGFHLQETCPGKTYAILEARDAIGGTWDLFRYPGIRSDSDMYTLGYAFRPWPSAKAIADGPSILSYVRETADEYGIDRHIRFHHRVVARRVVERRRALDRGRRAHRHRRDGSAHLRLPLHVQRLLPLRRAATRRSSQGTERFRGRIVHPQYWTDDLDYAGKRVVVIGSGATAVTLVPAMAPRRGARDDAPALAELRRLAAGRRPDRARAAQVAARAARLFDRPLEERAADDGDLPAQPAPRPSSRRSCCASFVTQAAPARLRRRDALHARATTRGTSGSAWCPTATCSARSATAAPRSSPTASRPSPRTGIELESGETLEADLIVTATGLNLLRVRRAGARGRRRARSRCPRRSPTRG